MLPTILRTQDYVHIFGLVDAVIGEDHMENIHFALNVGMKRVIKRVVFVKLEVIIFSKTSELNGTPPSRAILIDRGRDSEAGIEGSLNPDQKFPHKMIVERYSP
jgi:hypothetical protein